MRIRMSWRKTSCKDLTEYLLVILLLLEIKSVFSEAYYYDFHINEILCMVAALYFASSTISNMRLKGKCLFYILTYIAAALVFMLISVSEDRIVAYVCKFVLLIPLMFLLYVNETDLWYRIQIKMLRMTCVLAVGSLIMYIGGICLKIIPSMGTFTFFWGTVKKANVYGPFLFAEQQQEVFGIHIYRNVGIYTEGPIYGFILVMALAVRLFLLKSSSKWDIIVLCLTIVSTVSVTAMIFTVILLLLNKFLDWKSEGKIGVVSRGGIVARRLAWIALIPIAGFLVYELYNFKLNTGLSYMKRMDDIKASITAFKTSPIWGVGYGNANTITENYSSWRSASSGYSNGLFYILATCGLVGLFFYLYCLVWGAVKSRSVTENCQWIIFCVLIGLLMVTVVSMQIYVLNYLALGMAFVCMHKSKATEMSSGIARGKVDDGNIGMAVGGGV